jgi:hypothetical protein
MLTWVPALAKVEFYGTLSVTLNDSRLSMSGQSTICMRTVFVVSPGAKFSVPEVVTKSPLHDVP